MSDILEFELDFSIYNDDETWEDTKILFKINALRRKECMRLTHKFVGEMHKNDSNIMLIEFDVLEEIAEKLFKNGYWIMGRENGIINEEFWADQNKQDLFYMAVVKAVEANSPDFFRRMARS